MRALIGLGLITWAAAVMAMPNASHPLAAFTGIWAVKAEGRILMLLSLEPGSDSRTLSGVLRRPEHMSMSLSSGSVSSVSLPVEEERLIGAQVHGNGVRLRFEDPKNQITEWQLDLDETDTATLNFAGVPPGVMLQALHMFRVSADASVSADWGTARSYVLDRPDVTEADNASMTRLFEEDQADRKVGGSINLEDLARADAKRRGTVAEMLRRGELVTGQDFLHAAFIFQHGEQPQDYLLAHTLALAAVAKGRADATWIAAATLDRYLQSEGKPQVYGTQFRNQDQNPFDRALLPDALRLLMGVPSIADQRAPIPVLGSDSASAGTRVIGDSALWRDPNVRFIVIGETHGTKEEPALFGELVYAAAASGRPVVAAVEASETEQPAIDAFLASDGGIAAREAFRQCGIWRSEVKDGRSSLAYFELFERLRMLRNSGRLADVVAIQPTHILRKHAPFSDDDYNAAMADLIQQAGARRPKALVLVLVGNLHASKAPVVVGSKTILPATSHLPSMQTVSLRFTSGGEAWDCQGTDCRVHALPGARPLRREIQLGAGAPSGFDGTIDLGTRATASLPAADN